MSSMSLLEWLFEPANPGPVGKVEINSLKQDDDPEPPRKWLIYIAAVVGLCFAGFGVYWILNTLIHIGPVRTLGRLGLVVLYLATGLLVRPAPDTTNMGWLGGLMDHPFRISDDFNRLLLFTQVILFPGKVIAYCLGMCWMVGWRLFRNLNR